MTFWILTCYFTILGVLCIYGGHRLHITRLYKKHGRAKLQPVEFFRDLPRVTIQLPVFNEMFVVRRIIDAAAAIDYPKDRLQIQILDDSTDETCAIASERAAHFRNLGFDMVYLHRKDRSGYKAGALEAGMASATGEFIAIFDADFVPHPNILLETIHFFTDPKVGMVQTRWDHLNRNASTLTQVQAMMLDAHFVVEHGGRSASGLFFNFNGTAGIWRKCAIEEAGGWEHDTLTEDLDLSYRAQMKGWRFLFIEGVTCPSELPADMKAFKSQQHRWAKGSIEVMLKLLPRILKSRLPWPVKLEAVFHLTGNLAYLLMIINSIFFVIPSMMLRYEQPWWRLFLIDGPLFLMASISFVYFYLSAQKAVFKTTRGKRRFIPALMAVGIGLGVNNTRAVLEALFRHKTAFVRTPKSGDSQAIKKSYRLPKSGWGYLEIAIGFLYTCAIGWAIYLGNWASIPFLVLFQNGFYFVGWLTVVQERRALGKSASLGDEDMELA